MPSSRPRTSPARRFSLVRGRTSEPGEAWESDSIRRFAGRSELFVDVSAPEPAPGSRLLTSCASAVTQALARRCAFAGSASRARTFNRTVSVGWETLTLPIRAPGEVERSRAAITRFATLVLVATATYDETFDLASWSARVVSEVVSPGEPAVTKPVAVAS